MRPLAIAALAAVALVSPASATDVGQPAPAFTLPTAKGDTVALDKLRGQGRLRRFLGVVVRSVPPLVPVDERDAAEVRRQGLRDRRRSTSTRSASRRRSVSRSDIRRTSRSLYDEAGTTPSRVRVKGDAELLSHRQPRQGHRCRARIPGRAQGGSSSSASRAALVEKDAQSSRMRTARSLDLLARSPDARRMEPPQAVGEGQPRAARDAVRLRPTRHQDAAAHLHEQGSGHRRLRRRRRRLWLQLRAATRAHENAVGAHLLLSALALPGVVPVGATRNPLPTRASSKLQVPRATATGSRAQPHDGGRARVLRLGADRRIRGSSKAAWCTTRCPAPRRCTSTRCRARPIGTTTAPRATSRSPSTSATRRSSVGAFVSSEQDFLSRGGSLNVAVSSATTATARGLRRRRHQRSHQRSQRRGAQLDAQLARVPGRRHAGAVAQRHRAVEPHVLHGPRLLLRPVQAARHAADRAPDVGVAHALQPLLRGAGRDAARWATGCLFDSFGSTSNTLDVAWAQALPWYGITRHARAALSTRRPPRIST